MWYVAPRGVDSARGSQSAPLATPDRAIALARSGDVILVADGEYRIGSSEYAALTLRVPAVTLAAANAGKVTLTPANPNVKVAIAAEGDNLVVDGFVLKGFAAYGVLFGRLASPQRNLVLKHLVIDGASDGVRAAVAPVTPHTRPLVQGLLLYDVLIRNVNEVGFNCGEGPCRDMRLEALRVQMPGRGGGSGADAVAVEEGDNIVVFNAEVSGAAADGLDFKATRVAIANVIVHDVARNGVKLWRGGDVINALVYNTGADAAIVLDTGARYRLLNTTVARHARGVEAYAGTAAYDHQKQPGRLEIINSIFYQNTGPFFVSPAFTLNVRNSIFFNSPYAALEWRTLTIGEGGDSFAALEQAGGGCCNLGIVDPKFVNPDRGDYRLAAGSSARRAGTDKVEAFPTFDLVGNVRTREAGVDLGPIASR